jgi:hypothetical protein
MADGNRGPLEQVGEAIGETAGRVAGRMADLGTDVAGSVFGNAMEALGDWWGSAEAREAGLSFGDREDEARRHHEGSGADRSFDEVRPLYEFGHVASHNPDYAGRSFREVEPQLERAWNEGAAPSHGAWGNVRPFVGHGFEAGAPRSDDAGEGSIRRSPEDPLM